mgnify:CR=1 FL=1
MGNSAKSAGKHINYCVFVKASATSPWKYTGIIESSKATADSVWPDTITRLRYHSYKLEWSTYGIAIER